MLKYPRIAVIIVLYYSKELNYINLLSEDNLNIILVDNTPNRNLCIKDKNVYYIPLYKNYGIATAQNRGIDKAKDLGCSHIFFFDQDSIIEKNYISKMLYEYNRIKELYTNIAVLGPTIINKENGEKYKVANTPVKYDCKILQSVISSGSIIEMSIIDKVGLFDEELFIDYVDNEWGWRANKKGFICCMTTNISMSHKIGQKNFKILSVPFIISAPVRYYYQYRNYFWLIRRDYISVKWKLKSFIRKMVEIIIIPCVSENKFLVFKYIVKGIRDGLFRLK